MARIRWLLHHSQGKAMALAIRIYSSGAPEVMQLEELDLPSPGPGEVLLEQTAIGVNPLDVNQRKGMVPIALPSGLGLEGAGIVAAVGSGCRA
jgi:NADPH2:quinone reductase